MKISQTESSAISIVRIMAMLSIVVCHYLQAYNNNWAWVLNIGVQVFLVLSGYLYGHKRIDNWGKWYKMRVLKLYVPLFIYTTIVLTAIKYYTNTPVVWTNYITMSAISGIDHLWFMKAIAVCYIITPLLQFFRKYALYALIIVTLLGAVEYGFLHINLFKFSWIELYAIGYYYGALDDESKVKKGYLVSIVLIACAVTSFCTWSKILEYDGAFNRSWHDILGTALCIGGIFAFNKFSIFELPKPLKLIDHNSFYIYICHHIYLIGPLSLPLLIPNCYISASLAFVLIVVTTIIYACISNLIIDKLKSLI